MQIGLAWTSFVGGWPERTSRGLVRQRFTYRAADKKRRALLGGLFSLAGMGHRRRLHWLGTEVTVSPDGLEEKRGKKSLALPWHSIAQLNRRRWSQALAFEAG